MMITQRDYAGPADLIAMQHAVARTWTPAQRWHVGDLAWGRYSVPHQEPSWRTRLWESNGDVVAWGWAELPGDLGLYVDPAYASLADDVIAWFESVASGTQRSVTILETESHLAAALIHAGYASSDTGPFFQHCLIELDDSLPPIDVPAGYRIRAVRHDEAEARAAAHRSAWRPKRIGEMFVPPIDLGDAESDMTADHYRGVMRAWPYRPELDQVAEAPDGTLVAAALGWLDEANLVGELEPVGTDPRHGQRGLGSAVSMATLHAMRAAGATRAVVYPRGDDIYPVARKVYVGLGFRAIARTTTYIRQHA